MCASTITSQSNNGDMKPWRMLDFGQFDFGQFDFGQLAEVEIGRSRNWPKSKLIGRIRKDGVSISSFSLSFFFFCFFFHFSFLVGPPGLAHDSPGTPNVHISGFRPSKTPPKFHARTPREEEERKLRRRREQKREILGPPPFGAPLFSGFGSTLGASTLRGSTILGSTLRAPPFGLHPSRAPHFVVPKFNIQKLAEVEIGRSRNWPKSIGVGRSRSELAEVELAELEKKSWSKLAEVDHPRNRVVVGGGGGVCVCVCVERGEVCVHCN